MNGVRRLLGGAGQRPQSPPTSVSSESEPSQKSLPYTIAPLSIASKPLWQPAELLANEPSNGAGRHDSVSSSTISGPQNYTNGVNGANGPIKSHNGRQNSSSSVFRPQSIASTASSYRKSVPGSPGSYPDSAMRSSNVLSGPSSPLRPMPSRVTELKAWKRASGTVDTRDELLMALLASEAIVDSRDCDILHSEDVEELKKEQQVFESRLQAMQKKLKLETKIRDAAASLAKVNAGNKSVSKQSAEQLEAANRKVEAAQTELWRLVERSNEISKKLLEHRAGVLSFSVRNLEAKLTADEELGYGGSLRNTQMSPTSSETSYSSSRTKFEGAHLFAGHENAVVPLSPRKPPSAAEYSFLEERLKETSAKLRAASDAQSEARREAAMLKVELQNLETTLTFELQSAEERIASMKMEVEKVAGLERQLQEVSEREVLWNRERGGKQREIESLQRRLAETEQRSGEAAVGAEQRVVEIESALDALQVMMQAHGLVPPNNASHTQHVVLLETYLLDVQARLDANQRQRDEWEDLRHNLEDDVRISMDKREILSRELEEARKEREEYREKVHSLEASLKEQASIHAVPVKQISYEDCSADVKDLIQVLLPVWSALPSLELRASKFGLRPKNTSSVPGSPNVSLSDLDVRLLKTLYDGRPSYQLVDSSSQFTIEAFAARVHALIQDDKALIERLVRFAQAHELLKQNADRAQKIAQESSVALETYQKQVKALEERNMTLSSSINSLQCEIVELRETIDKVMSEKREMESQAAEQAETCRQLTEANNTLSARALSLAEEVATAPEAIRNQLEKQLSECRAELQKAQEEIDTTRSAGASQNIALMDELNQMQSENEMLRAQLRAMQAGKK